MGFWLTKEEKKSVEKEMKDLGIDVYSDYILYKLGLDRGEEDNGEEDNGE